MLSKEVLGLLNKQLNHELSNAMLYRQLSSVANMLGYLGCEKLMRSQYEGELEHFNLVCDYITDRNYPFTIKDPSNPTMDGINSLDGICKAALEREQDTTEMLEAIRLQAIEDKDMLTETFLFPMLVEQREEENLFYNILAQLKIAAGDRSAILLIDSQMGK
jgi:ferritin